MVAFSRVRVAGSVHAIVPAPINATTTARVIHPWGRLRSSLVMLRPDD
jgi:hypothetical protein